MMALAKGILFTDPYLAPLAPLTAATMPGAKYVFWLSRTSGQLEAPATLYANLSLSTPIIGNVIPVNSTGKISPVYLNPFIPLRVQLFDPNGRLLMDVDPYLPCGRYTGSVAATATFTLTSSTLLVPDTALNLTLPHPGTYRYEAYVEFVLGNTSNNPGIQFAMYLLGSGGGSGGGTGNFNTFAIEGGLLRDVPPGLIPASLAANPIVAADYFADPGSGTTYEGSSGSSTVVTAYPTVLSTSTHQSLRITGAVTVNAPCVLAFCWAPNTNSSTPVTRVPGSYLKALRI